MRFQHLVFRTIPQQLVEWFDGELEKRGIDSAYTHCILSILQGDHHDTEPDEFIEVKNRQLKAFKKYGGPESLYSANKSKHQKWKTYDEHILLNTSTPCFDVSISDLERKKRNAAVSCLKSVSDDVAINDLIDELCLRLKNVKIVNERKNSVMSESHNTDKETPFYIPPSSPTDQVEKYFAAFPCLEKQSENKSDLSPTVNSSAWSGSCISTNKILGQSIVQKNVKYFEKCENFKNKSYGSLKSIENIYIPSSNITENIAKKTNPANRHGNSFQMEFCDENTCNFSAIRKSGNKLHNPLTGGMNINNVNELDSKTNSENICSVISTSKSAFEKPKPCQTLNSVCLEYNSHKAELNSAQKIKILSSSTYQLVTSRNKVNKNSDLRSISSANLFMPIKKEISLNPILHLPSNAEKLQINITDELENCFNSTKSCKCSFKEPVLKCGKEFKEIKKKCGKNNFIALKIDYISNGKNKAASNKLACSSQNVLQEFYILESNQNVNSASESNFVLDKKGKVKIDKFIECNNEVVSYFESINEFKKCHVPHFMKISLNIPGKHSKTKFVDHNFEKSFFLVFEKISCDVSKIIMKIIEAIQFKKQIKHKSLISCSQLFSANFVLRKVNGSYKIDKTSFAMKLKKLQNISKHVSKDLSKTKAKRNKTGSSNKYCSACFSITEKCSSIDVLVENENSNTCNKDVCPINFSPDKFKTTPENSNLISSKYVTSQISAEILEMEQSYDDSNKCVNYESFNSKINDETSKIEYLCCSELFPKFSGNLMHEEKSPSVSIHTYHNISVPYLRNEYTNFMTDSMKEERVFFYSEKYPDIESVAFTANVCKCFCTNVEKELHFQAEYEISSINLCICSSEMIEEYNSKPYFELPISLKYLVTFSLICELSLLNVLKTANFNLELIHQFSKANLTEKGMFEIITDGSLIDVEYIIDLFSSLGYFNHTLSLNVGKVDFILPNKKVFVPKYCMKQCINDLSSGAKSDCEMEYLYSSKLFLSVPKLFDNLKKKKVTASFSIPSYPLSTPCHLKYKDTNHTRSDIKLELYLSDSTIIPLNTAIYSEQSEMNTKLSIPWPIFSDLTETENLDLDESHELYFSCEPCAQKQSLYPQNPASQVFSWKYPSFTDSYIQKSDDRSHNLSANLTSSSHIIHKDSSHDKNIYQHSVPSQPLIDNQNIQYFTNPFNMGVESKIGSIFQSKSEDINSSDNVLAVLHDHEFEKPYLSSLDNTETKNFASNPHLPLCFPSAFEPFKRCNYAMPKERNFSSSGQQLLKKAINVGKIIQEVSANDRIAFIEKISSFSEPDDIVSNLPLKVEQISDPIYNDANDKEHKFKNPLWSVDSVNPSSCWSNQYNFKSIWSDDRDSVDYVWKNDPKTLENNESCYARSDFSDPYASCNDSMNEDNLLRGLFPLPDLKVKANIAYENDNYNYNQSCGSYNVISEQPINILNQSSHDVLASGQTSNFSTGNNNVYSLSVPHNDPVGFFCLDNCKSDDIQRETNYLGTDYPLNVDAQAYQALNFTDLSAFRGPYGSCNEYGINYMEGGDWNLNPDSYMVKPVDSQGSILFLQEYAKTPESMFLQNLYPTESESENFDNMQPGIMLSSLEDEEIANCVTRKSHTKPLPTKRPCLFYIEGSCIHQPCKYSHDLSSTTCRFWIRGSCFKGSLCPFLHGNVEEKIVEEQEIVKESEPGNIENFYSLDSEMDFPSLSSSKSEMSVSKSEPVNIKHVKLPKKSRPKSHQ